MSSQAIATVSTPSSRSKKKWLAVTMIAQNISVQNNAAPRRTQWFRVFVQTAMPARATQAKWKLGRAA